MALPKQMLRKLLMVMMVVISTSASASTCQRYGIADEQTALALNMFYEAGGEKNATIAMQLVGEVTLNRVENDRYPDSICDVIYQNRQFSWTSTNKRRRIPSDSENWNAARQLASQLIDGDFVERSDGATHFINPKRASPDWTRRMKKVKTYGNHTFYRAGVN
jgi:N-acetylmuramoyl-L-alanine amidase